MWSKRLFTLFSYGKYVCLGFFSIFFVSYGITLLISSYSISDPFNFIMSFFSSNLIILIGLVPIVGLIFRIYERCKKNKVGN